MLKKALMCFCILTLFTVSCSNNWLRQLSIVDERANNLWENPSPKPVYITNIYFGSGIQCLDVYLRFFTDEQTTSPNIGLTDLTDKVQFVIDGNNVDPEELANDRY